MAGTTLSDRALVRLSGENVREFLQGLVTSDLNGDLPLWTALLTPQGKCLFDFIVWSDGDDLLLDCEAAEAENLIRRLGIYRLRRKILIELELSLGVHWSRSSGEIRDPRLDALGWRWLAPPSAATNDWLAHRLGLGVCEGKAELGELLWLECNAAELNGVSFTKGCFVGQENTARMNWRQKINRRLFVTRGGCGNVRVEHRDLGLSVIHARVDAVPDSAIVPDWLADALAQPSTA